MGGALRSRARGRPGQPSRPWGRTRGFGRGSTNLIRRDSDRSSIRPSGPWGSHLTSAKLQVVGGEGGQGGKIKILCPTLGNNGRGQVVVETVSEGYRIEFTSSPRIYGRWMDGWRKGNPDTHRSRPENSSRGGDTSLAGKAGTHSGTGRYGTTFLVHVHSNKEKGRIVASHPKPKTPQQRFVRPNIAWNL